METEVAALIGVERHGRTGERTAYRNGSRTSNTNGNGTARTHSSG